MMTDMFLLIDNSKAGKYAFALTGRRLSTHIIPRVSLRFTLGYALLRFAFPFSRRPLVQRVQPAVIAEHLLQSVKRG